MTMAAPGVPIGTRIKRAREAKRWSQQELAGRIGVDRKSVDNWENHRTYPRSSIGALEQVLQVSLTEEPEIYTDPDEAQIWSWARYSKDQRRELIGKLREIRGDSPRQAAAGETGT